MNEQAIWEGIVAELGWTGMTMVNLAETLVRRHAASGRVALFWEGRDGTLRSFTFGELAARAAQHAGMLRKLGIGEGDRVACIMPRVPEAIVSMLGAFHVGAIHLPIFSGFGVEATARRIADAGARVVVTHADVRERLPATWSHPVSVVTERGADGAGVRADDLDYHTAISSAPPDLPPAQLRRDQAAVLLFTSGSTGPPKAVTIATNFPAAIWPAIRYAGNLCEGDIFWPTGDPGWGYGMVCYAVALAAGIPCAMLETNPTPEITLDFMARHRISVVGTVPTLLRGLMALGEAPVARQKVAVRSIMSCGEPLNAECVTFFRRVWGVTPLDQFGSSEHGLPIGNSFSDRDGVRPGSMGKPLPGQKIAIVDESGAIQTRGSSGLIATMPPADGIYSLGYWNNPEAETGLRRQGWIVTGDIGHEDQDGYYWFEGRLDDVIKSSGYRVGPFEIESALLTHPDVAEAAVVGKPDAARGQLIKAFVVLRTGAAYRPSLYEELVTTVRREVGAHAYPREIEIVTELPKTNTGKIQRFVLRNQEASKQTGTKP